MSSFYRHIYLVQPTSELELDVVCVPRGNGTHHTQLSGMIITVGAPRRSSSATNRKMQLLRPSPLAPPTLVLLVGRSIDDAFAVFERRQGCR